MSPWTVPPGAASPAPLLTPRCPKNSRDPSWSCASASITTSILPSSVDVAADPELRKRQIYGLLVVAVLLLLIGLGRSSAQQFDGEIVSCASLAVYEGVEIGFAKPAARQRQHGQHHGRDGVAQDG